MRSGCLGSTMLLMIVSVARAESTANNNLVQGDCNAVGSGNHVTCNDVQTIRQALEPSLRGQLDRVLPNLEAQRKLFESLILHASAASTREHTALSSEIAQLKMGMRAEMKQ